MADIRTSACLPVLRSAGAGFPQGLPALVTSLTLLSRGRHCNLASAGTVSLKHPWFRWLMASLLCMNALWSPVQLRTAGAAWSALSSWFLLRFGHTSVPWQVQPVRPPLNWGLLFSYLWVFTWNEAISFMATSVFVLVKVPDWFILSRDLATSPRSTNQSVRWEHPCMGSNFLCCVAFLDFVPRFG